MDMKFLLDLNSDSLEPRNTLKEANGRQTRVMITKLELYQKTRVNPYKPSILFVGQRQTMQTQIRRRILRRLIRVSTVCLQNVLLKFE